MSECSMVANGKKVTSVIQNISQPSITPMRADCVTTTRKVPNNNHLNKEKKKREKMEWYQHKVFLLIANRFSLPMGIFMIPSNKKASTQVKNDFSMGLTSLKPVHIEENGRNGIGCLFEGLSSFFQRSV